MTDPKSSKHCPSSGRIRELVEHIDSLGAHTQAQEVESMGAEIERLRADNGRLNVIVKALSASARKLGYYCPDCKREVVFGDSRCTVTGEQHAPAIRQDETPVAHSKSQQKRFDATRRAHETSAQPAWAYCPECGIGSLRKDWTDQPPVETSDRPSDCSGDPNSCPDNEGTGCHCSRSAAAAHEPDGCLDCLRVERSGVEYGPPTQETSHRPTDWEKARDIVAGIVRQTSGDMRLGAMHCLHAIGDAMRGTPASSGGCAYRDCGLPTDPHEMFCREHK